MHRPFRYCSIPIGIAALMLSAFPAMAADPPRIASMNVCTDQLLLTLADPAQILGLSRYSREQLSLQSDAQRYSTLSGGAEDIMVLKPDVVVASLFDKRSTREMLKAHGFRLAEFGVPRSLNEARDHIRHMGEITGHPDRAAAEIARLDDAMTRARAIVADKHFRVLALSRRGWVSGNDSLLSSLLTETGLIDVSVDLGVASGGYASLEAIVKLKPDLIAVSQGGDVAEDEGRAFLLHPALERFYPPEKRLVIPDRLTECGSVLLADALDMLVAELKRVAR